MLFIPGHIQPGKDAFRLPKLPFTAVYQDNVRNLVLFYCLTIAGGAEPVHRRIIIARGNAGNIVTSILGTQWPLLSNTTQGSHRLFTHSMADIKAFHTFNGRQFQYGSQGLQTLMDRRLLESFVVSAVAALVRASFR